MDYLLKPFDRERFRKAISRARALVESNRPTDPVRQLRGAVQGLAASRKPAERFAIRTGGRILVVKPDEVDWIRCADNYSELHVGGVVHLLRQTLGTLEEQLQGADFVRISRSLMVNANRIREIRSKTHGDYLVVLLDGTELGASRNYRGALARLLGKSPG
jgi:two-component system LytT family response regulator